MRRTVPFRFCCPFCTERGKKTTLGGKPGSSYIWECPCGGMLTTTLNETGSFDLHWFPPKREPHLKLVPPQTADGETLH